MIFQAMVTARDSVDVTRTFTGTGAFEAAASITSSYESGPGRV